MFRRAFISLTALLATPILSENHPLKLSYPEPAWSYDSIVGGSEVDGFRKGHLDVFPCSAEQRPQPLDHSERLLVPLSAFESDATHLRFGLIDGSVASTDVSFWEVNYWWGRFEDAPFENGDQAYSWGEGTRRRYRISGEREWCSEPLIFPYSYQRLGEPWKPDRRQIDMSQLDGTKATLAVRFGHFSFEDDMLDGDVVPRNVTTACVFVKFTAEDVPFGETCPASSSSRAAWQSETPQELRRRRVTGPSDRRLTTISVVGIAVSVSFVTIVGAWYCCCRGCIGAGRANREEDWRERMSARYEGAGHGGSSGRPMLDLQPARARAPPPARDPEVVPVPVPAPAPAYHRPGHESRLLNEALPKYGELPPPRYEEVAAGPGPGPGPSGGQTRGSG